jgi:tripartite-type tricarboxylate transporter receptor subunit TctC
MTSTTRRTILGASLAPLGAPALAQPRWPARPVQLLCPWAAGGGTDAVVRIVASLLQRDLNQPFNVVNRTGGSGVVGHAAIAGAAPDGYTLGIITAEICMLHWQGLTELTYRNFTPLGLMNNDPPGIQVSNTSPYRDVNALADAIKASRPGQLKASGTGQGGIWHLALAGWLGAMGCGRTTCAGCPPTAPRRPCRTSPPAGSTSPPTRCPRRAPSSTRAAPARSR